MSKRSCQYGLYFDFSVKNTFLNRTSREHAVRLLQTVPVREVYVSNFEPSADAPKVRPRPFASPVLLSLSSHHPLIAL
jgi:hypothetical protein